MILSSLRPLSLVIHSTFQLLTQHEAIVHFFDKSLDREGRLHILKFSPIDVIEFGTACTDSASIVVTQQWTQSLRIRFTSQLGLGSCRERVSLEDRIHLHTLDA